MTFIGLFSSCSRVDKCDRLFTDIHFSRHLTPATDTTEGGIKAVITDRTLETDRQRDGFIYKYTTEINEIKINE